MEFTEYAGEPHVVCGVVIVGVVFLASIVDRLWYTQDVSTTYQTEYDRKIRQLCQQAVHWITTAEQDREPSIAAIHYTHAIAYIQAALEFSDPATVSEHIHTDATTLLDRLRRKQATRFKELFESCPRAAPQVDVPLSGWLK